MIRSAVTVSLVEEARGGPFVFWNGLADACESAASLGFDGIEIFAPSPTAVDRTELRQLLERHRLIVAAVGTGAGMVRHGLSLTDPNPGKRQAARDFIRAMIEFGADFQAPAIVGSMQGKWGGDVRREQALIWLTEGLNELGSHASRQGVRLIYEPLNRYETNLLKTVEEGVAFLRGLDTGNVRLLADLFHMNIEEADLGRAIRVGGEAIGHIHFVDSNRQAAGFGHLDFEPIRVALTEINFNGFLSAEAFPIPNSYTAAKQTIDRFRQIFPR